MHIFESCGTYFIRTKTRRSIIWKHGPISTMTRHKTQAWNILFGHQTKNFEHIMRLKYICLIDPKFWSNKDLISQRIGTEEKKTQQPTIHKLQMLPNLQSIIRFVYIHYGHDLWVKNRFFFVIFIWLLIGVQSAWSSRRMRSI